MVCVHIYFTEQYLYKCISLSAAQKEKDFLLMQIKGLLDVLTSQLATQFSIANDCRTDFCESVPAYARRRRRTCCSRKLRGC